MHTAPKPRITHIMRGLDYYAKPPVIPGYRQFWINRNARTQVAVYRYRKI